MVIKYLNLGNTIAVALSFLRNGFQSFQRLIASSCSKFSKMSSTFSCYYCNEDAYGDFEEEGTLIDEKFSVVSNTEWGQFVMIEINKQTTQLN